MLSVFALGIPASTGLLLRSPASRDRLHDLARNAIRSELGLNATIGGVQLQLVPFALVARNIALDDPIYGRIAEAAELEIEPSFQTLVRGGLDINAITIREANVRLVLRNGQIRNLPRAEGPGGDGPIQLPFDSLHVLDSSLTLDAEPHASGQLSDVELHLRALEGGIGLETHVGGGWVRHAGGRETLQRLEGRVEVREGSISVPLLSLRTPELLLRLREVEAPLTLEDHGYRGEIALAYDLAHLARLPLPPEVTLPHAEGRVALNVRLDSEGDDQRAEGTVDLDGARLEQFGLGETAHLIVRADRRRIQILEGSTVQNTSQGGEIHLDGAIILDPDRGFPVDVTATVEDLSFARLMSLLGVTENGIVEWIFNGPLELRGTLVPLDLRGPVRFRTRDFQVSHDPWHARRVRRVIGVPRADFTGRWSIQPDAVRFTNLVGDLAHSRIRADVHLGFDNQLRVQATANPVDLRDITPLDRWPIGGVGSARVEIDQTFQDPHVAGRIQLSDFFFDNFRLGDVASDAVLDPDGMGVRFAMVDAVRGESRYRAEDLYLDFHDNRFAMSGMLHLDSLRLEDFYGVFGLQEDERYRPYQGLARGDASLRYTNGYPGDRPSGTLDVDMNLDFDWATLDDYRFTDGRFVGRWRWLDWEQGAAGGELSVAYASFRKDGGTLTVEGEMSLGGNLDMRAVADRVALASLEGIGDRLPGVGGVASAVGHIGGTFELMRANFDVGVTNVTYDGRPLGDGRFFVRLADREDPYAVAARSIDPESTAPCAHARRGLANADWPADPPVRTVDGPQVRLVRPMAYMVCGSALDGRLDVDLAVGRTRALPLRGLLRFDGLEVAPFLPELVADAVSVGTLEGELDFLDGALREPETLEGSLTLRNVEMTLSDIEIQNRGPIALSFDSGVLSVNKARFAGADSSLRVRGVMSLDDGYGLSIDSSLDLGLLSGLSSSLDGATGRVTVGLNVSGPLDDPELFGEATVTDGSLALAALDSPVEDLTGRIRFSQRSVLFEDFRATAAGGDIEASGEAEIRERGLERYRFDIGARGLRQTFGQGVEASFGAQTRLEWSDGERLPRLTGELSVDRFDYSRPIELRSLGDVAGNAVRGIFRRSRAEVRRYDPDEDTVDLDVRVVQRGPFLIQNNLLSAEVRVDTEDRPFRILGTDQRYGVDGSMSLSRGNISFQNSEFEVRRGTIRFDDTTRIDPHLDIEAVTDINRSSDLSSINWRVTLRLTGSTDNLRLETASDPDLPEPDILMLLAFGMTRAELQQLQASDIGGVAALEALSSATGVDRALVNALPLVDDIRLTTGYSQRTGRSEPRLSVGKRLAERIRLSATTGLGEGREFRGALEWQLDDNMRIGLSYDNYNIDPANSFGNLGVDWGYRLEFE